MFRPVVNFMLRKTKKPDEKVIELLAWLINFEPRPFNYGKKYIPDDTVWIDDDVEEMQEEEEKEPDISKPQSFTNIEKQPEGSEITKPVVNNNPFHLIRRNHIMIMAILILTGGAI